MRGLSFVRDYHRRVDANTRSIVELAWARVLKLPDHALLSPLDTRITREDDSMIMYVRLWQHEVLVAPVSVIEQAVDLAPDTLADGPSLLRLGAGCTSGAARLLGAATLGFSDTYVAGEELQSTPVTDDSTAVADLERECPPDDVAEVGLSGMGWSFVLLDDDEATLAGAGFDEWEHILAHVGILTPPRRRRAGHARTAAGIATNEALDRGLIPQWRARTDNAASRGLAARLGYETVGTQTTVSLGG